MTELNKSMQIYAHELLAGRLCLDFANTVSWHDGGEKSQEWLTSYETLVNWSVHADILTEQQADPLLTRAIELPSEAKKVLDEAIELRESIYRLFSSISNNKTPSPIDLSILNGALSKAYGKLRVVPETNQYSLEFINDENTLDRMIPPIIQSTTNILVSEKELKRVKKCEGDPCGWLFMDTSRNSSRRWCSMKDCGNRAKARRFYERKK